MREVKMFRVSGVMNLYRTGERQKFTIEIPALRAEHAVERVLSELGSRHKLSRKHIAILEVREIDVNEATKNRALELYNLDKVVCD